jgi:hypothetical protein
MSAVSLCVLVVWWLVASRRQPCDSRTTHYPIELVMAAGASVIAVGRVSLATRPATGEVIAVRHHHAPTGRQPRLYLVEQVVLLSGDGPGPKAIVYVAPLDQFGRRPPKGAGILPGASRETSRGLLTFVPERPRKRLSTRGMRGPLFLELLKRFRLK